MTLNVWSPDLGAKGIPVMVFIHGGAYQKGSSSNPHYECGALAGAGVVVVSVNYRVGVEGFAHISSAPDNRGILDQAAALGWVQTNIAAFGGDPGNVTVFGQSAGAGSIAALLAMPAAAGLFQRAVAQSVPGTFFSTGLAADISAAIAAELHTEATVDELAGICPHALVRATDAVVQRLPQMVDRWGPMALTPTPFSPVVDGAVLPRAPWAAIADGAAAPIDLLVGHTRDEYRLLAARLSPEVTDDQVSVLLDWLAPGPHGASSYRCAYPGATPARLRELVMADWLLRMPSLHLAEAQLAGGGNAWTYELCWGYGPNGASHGLDLLLLLGTIDYDDIRAHGEIIAEQARHLSGRMRADWVNFATTGDLGWAPYDTTCRSTRVYDAQTTTRPYPEERSRRIWQEHLFDTLDLPAGHQPARQPTRHGDRIRQNSDMPWSGQ